MLKFMYITNRPDVANIAQSNGVDRIFVDLEIIGKEKRQGHLNTVISHHSIDDVKKIREVLSKSELLVRINPIHNNSEQEINNVIAAGADIIMLPFFLTSEEVEHFISIVDGRALTCLLIETPSAVQNIDDILSVEAIDMIHIGLNDLHLGYGMKFMFEPLANGMIEGLCKKIKQKGIPYGFGGIAQLGQGLLPAEYVIAEHYRLGSSMAILSRSFCNLSNEKNIFKVEENFKNGIEKIRDYEKTLFSKSNTFFEDNKNVVVSKVMELIENINNI